MSAFDEAIAPTFAAQLGLATRTQVLAAGGTQRQIDVRLRNGSWTLAERAVYAMAGVGWTWRRHLGAVVLSVPEGFASHRAAAKLLGVGQFARPPIELTVPAGRMPTRSFAERSALAGCRVVVHQVEDVALEAPVLVDGIPTSGPLRLAVDVGRCVPDDRYRALVGELIADHGLAWLDLERLWRRHSRQGRDGCGPLHRLVDDHFLAVGAPAEVIEARCLKLLADAGLPAPTTQFEVIRRDGRRARLDLAYPALRIGIETEGAIHDRGDVRQADHQRRNQLQLDGWILFHFTWADIVRRPEHVVRTVRDALAARSSSAH